MFYTNKIFETEILSYVEEAKQLVEHIDTADDKHMHKAISEIEIALIVRSTGKIELYFDDIMREFAMYNCSEIFYKYFNRSFTEAGKNAKPEAINAILKLFDVEPIKKNSYLEEYTSLDTLYNIRNSIAHGDCNISNTFEQITDFITYSIGYLEIVIEHLDSKYCRT